MMFIGPMISRLIVTMLTISMLPAHADEADMGAMVKKYNINRDYYQRTYTPFNFTPEYFKSVGPYNDKTIRHKQGKDKIEVVKAARGRSIYVLQRGKMRHVPDWDTYLSLGLDRYSVVTMNHLQIEAYPKGEDMTLKDEADIP